MISSETLQSTMSDQVIQVGQFLGSIDDSLLKYEEDFRNLDFMNTKCLKYFKSKDFNKFQTHVSDAHRRMLMNNISKLQTPTSKLGVDESPDEKREERHRQPNSGLQPKQLFSDTTPDTGTPTQARDNPHFVYKTPIETELEELNDSISMKETEYQSADEYYQGLNNKYNNPSIRLDRSARQCGRCHLHLGHTKNKCTSPPCESAEQCNDIDKHTEEKKVLAEASEFKRKLWKDLERETLTLKNKEKLFKDINCTFESQITPHLVNTKIDKYTFVTPNGRLLKNQLIKNDIYIIEKHYRGVIPKNPELECKRFQDIISKFNNENKIKPPDPVKKRLEDNVVYPVKFPKFVHDKTPENTRDTDQTPATCTSVNYTAASPVPLPGPSYAVANTPACAPTPNSSYPMYMPYPYYMYPGMYPYTMDRLDAAFVPPLPTYPPPENPPPPKDGDTD